MNPISLTYWLTQSGYFGLIILIFCWHLWIQPLPREFISITLLVQIGPLMFPLKGLLHGKPYTYAWASYLALGYFVLGIWYASGTDTRLFGSIIALFSMMFFVGAILFARFKARALKQEAVSNPENTV
ncbi:MAG: DUF2069 domain-containing protein [Gammaproteobacteria bacterium]|nr:MAG: DUF2069 domain-containing protein [Gammaproteobacteria bacterium]